MWEEIIEPIRRPPSRQLAEHIREVRKRRDAVLGAGARQAVQVRRPSRRIVRAREQVVLPTECDVSELLFAEVVVCALKGANTHRVRNPAGDYVPAGSTRGGSGGDE